MEKKLLPLIGGLDISKDQSRKIIIGDIHGCFHTLERLLGELGSKDGYHPPEGYKILSLGDLNNKGANSIAVLNWAMDLTAKDMLYTVDSNHGRRLARRLSSNCRPGGEVERTYREIKKLEDLPYEDKVVDYLSSLPAYIKASGGPWGEYYVAHAAGSPRLLEKSELSNKERNFFLGTDSFRWSGSKLIVTGHVTVKNPTKEIHAPTNGTVIRLDTGVNLGNLLSAYLPEDDKFISVKTDIRDL